MKMAAAGLVVGAGCRRKTQVPTRAAEPTPEGDDPFAELRGMLDDVAPPDASEREQHLACVRARMRELDVSALVVEPGPGMTYLTGVGWGRSERPFLLVVPADGDPAWVCPAFELRTAREQLGPDAEVMVWQEHQSPYARVSEILLGRGLAGDRVAVDPDARTFVTLGLTDVLGAELVDVGHPVLAACRIRKKPPELTRLRRANEATKAALALAAQQVRPGMSQTELATLVRQAQEAAGLQQVWVLALFGPAAAFPHGTREDRIWQPTDLILVDTGGSLHGYRSDITRTWAPTANASDEAQRAWETVRRAQAEAMRTIRPGVTCGRPDAAARAVMDEAGYGRDYELFTHRLGHGIGLEVHEPPYLVKDSDRVLEPGMTMSNEPGLYIAKEHGIRIEDIIAVTDDGIELFGPPIGPFDDPFAGHLDPIHRRRS